MMTSSLPGRGLEAEGYDDDSLVCATEVEGARCVPVRTQLYTICLRVRLQAGKGILDYYVGLRGIVRLGLGLVFG